MNDILGTCKLCGEQAKLINAHLIPRKFYEAILAERGVALSLTTESGKYPSKTPSGIYDPNLVCLRCEQTFSPWDSYAADVLSTDAFKQKPIIGTRGLLGYIVEQYDYPLLKLFFMSLLWRCGATNRDEFSNVRLGPHLEKLAQMVRDGNPGKPDDFGVVLTCFKPLPNDMHNASHSILDPHAKRFDGRNMYRFCFAGWTPFMKVDSQPLPPSFVPFSLAPNKPLLILARDFPGSSEARDLVRVVMENVKNTDRY